MTVKIRVLGIQIGYQSKKSDTGHADRPQMQIELEKLFTKEILEGFWKESIVPFKDPPSDDEWAADHIREVINKKLVDLKKPELKVAIAGEDLRHLAKDGDIPPSDSGSHGTRCEQRGDKWINSRSYRLSYADESRRNSRWPPVRKPDDAFLFATLVWQCWPKVE